MNLDIKLCACTELSPIVRMLWGGHIVFILVQVILCPHPDCDDLVMVIFTWVGSTVLESLHLYCICAMSVHVKGIREI